MHSKHLRSLLAFLIALLLLFPALPAAAAELPAPTDLTGIQNYPEAPETEAPATILMEAKTGAILYQKNMNQTYYPASITKVMTALLTIENCSLDETVTFSYRATHELEPGSSSIARTEGEELSVRDCLYALLFSSANEVAPGASRACLRKHRRLRGSDEPESQRTWLQEYPFHESIWSER